MGVWIIIPPNSTNSGMEVTSWICEKGGNLDFRTNLRNGTLHLPNNQIAFFYFHVNVKCILNYNRYLAYGNLSLAIPSQK